MTCPDARELFSAMVDGALDAGERAALDAHLVGCAACRHELERFRATVALLRAVEPERAPVGFVDRVLEAAHPAPWHRRLVRALFLPWPVKLPLEALAIVLIGVIVVTMFRATPELQQALRVEPPSPVSTEAPRRQAPPAAERPPTLDDEADAARRRDFAKAAPAPAPPATAPTAPAGPKVQPPAGVAKESAKPDVAASRLSGLRPATSADVSGRLAVKDREATLSALAALVAKTGSTEVSRRVTEGAAVIELSIPRAAWAEFTRELTRLGAWSLEREPAALPAEIRVTLRITE